MATLNEIAVTVTVKKWAVRLCYPMWAAQVFFGKRPYIPNWCLSVKA